MTLVGVGYRPEISGLCHGEERVVDCLELIGDRYFGEKGFSRSWELRSIAGVPTIIHGLCGNAASVYGPDTAYLERVRRLADAIGAIACSDHLAFTRVAGRDFTHLAPNLFDDDLIAAAARNVKIMADVTGRRICLENLATKTTITGSRYTPEEFYLRLLEASDQWDCLLDLTNLWLNSRNRLIDPLKFIDALPADRIGYIHLAGGVQARGEWIDSHSMPVHDEVFELLEYLLARSSPAAVIIERDSNWHGAAEELQADVGRVRRIVAACQLPDEPRSVPHSGPGRYDVARDREDGVVELAHRIGRAAAPFAVRHDRESTFVAEGYQAIRDCGYGAVAVPRELGGGGHDLATICRAQAVLAQYCANTALAIAMHQHTVLALAWRWRLGDRAVASTLRRIAVEGLLLSSSGAVDHANPGLAASPVAAGLLVTGRKRLCSGAPGADLIATLARVDDGKQQWTVTVLIPKTAPGVNIVPGWDAMGMRGSGSNPVSFSQVFVPDANVLEFTPLWTLPGSSGPGGPPDSLGGDNSRLPGLQIALPVITSVYLGTASAVHDKALELAAAGDADPAQQRIAGLLTQESRCAWWAFDALLAAAPDDSIGTEDHFRTTMLAKRQVVLSSIRVVELAMELVGSRSYDRSLPFEQALRDVRAGITHPLSPERTLLEVGRSVLQSAPARPHDDARA
jgi:uncharacterized protein (UPF0276 family)/alkylation response protein AidB-like acyl-CoA dehydrogenase